MKFQTIINKQSKYIEHMLISEHVKIEQLLKNAFDKLYPGLYIGLTTVGYRDNGREYSLSPEKNGKYSIKDFKILNNDVEFTGTQNSDCIFLSVSDIPFDKAFVKIFVELDKEKYESVFKLTKKDPYFHTYESVVDATVNSLKRVMHDLFRSDKSLFFEMPAVAELVKNGCRSFLESFLIIINGCNADRFEFNLYDDLQEISFQKYEKKPVHGSIIFASKENPHLEKEIEFEEEYRISDIRRIRKYLELTNGDLSLLADSGMIYGVGRYKRDNEKSECLFIVEFEDDGEWSVYNSSNKILSVKNGNPSIYFQKVSEQEIKDRIKGEFKNVTTENVDCLCKCVFSLINQNKGGILVISDISEAEANRLKNDSTMIKKMKVDESNIAKMSSIDGAILVDESCFCYAIGVILDGFATQKGNSTRGARYNSSVRYSESLLKKGAHVLVIIISDDGNVNILPQLEKK